MIFSLGEDVPDLILLRNRRVRMGQGHNRRIFISYRREETAAYAGRLYDRLSDHFGDAQVFMDVDSIEPGSDFTQAIRNAVASCHVLLAMIGREWLDLKDSQGQRRIDNPNDYVRIEIETALERNVRVIPILVDRAEMPRQEELPSPLQPLARRQAFEVNHSQFRAESDYLVKLLEDRSTRETSSQHVHSSPASESDAREYSRVEPIPKWRLDRVESGKYRKVLLVSRIETHKIEYIVDLQNKSFTHIAPELIKVDGKVERNEDPLVWREDWPFSLVDGNESVPARITYKKPFWNRVVSKFKLEISGQLLYKDE